MKEVKTQVKSLVQTGTGTGTQVSTRAHSGAVAYLQSIYRNHLESTAVRMKAAIEAAPYESAKRSTVSINYDDSFAAKLEKAIAMSNMKLIEGKVILNDPERD
jgi:hypothetical protein